MPKKSYKQECELDDLRAIKRAIQILKDPKRFNVVTELLKASAPIHTTINITNLYGGLNMNTQKGECSYG